MDRPHFTAWEHELLYPFLVMGREIARVAQELQADYLTVHMPIADGELVGFTWERGALWISGNGFDVELSANNGMARMGPPIALANSASPRAREPSSCGGA